MLKCKQQSDSPSISAVANFPFKNNVENYKTCIIFHLKIGILDFKRAESHKKSFLRESCSLIFVSSSNQILK